ncbi:MAG: HpsJ family protein [Lyngbya sp.]|nr:HpsJ family protein [Lyngbya sp.]
MTQSQNNPLSEKVDALWKFSSSLLQTIPPLRWVGYTLLILTLIDLIVLLIPPQFTNPVWEFQTMGAIVERVAVPLIGFVLVFYGEQNLRPKWERPLLKFLSLLTLLFGIVLLLFLPLGVINTFRINQQSDSQINTQVEQRITQIQQVQQQLEQATTEEQMENLLSRLDTQGRTPEIQSAQELEEIKNQLSNFISRTESTTKTEAEATRKNRRILLLKNSIKWNLGALISGVLFIAIWKATAWTRQRT